MRNTMILSAFLCALAGPCLAQDGPDTSIVTPEQRRSVGPERAAEMRALFAAARKRQQRIDQQNTDLWTRWTHAVCLGCGSSPRGVRIVHTNPLRVLAGIPAAEDDAREQRRRRVG